MKIVNQTKLAKPTFQPITIQITLQNMNEVRCLWHRLTAGCGKIDRIPKLRELMASSANQLYLPLDFDSTMPLAWEIIKAVEKQNLLDM